MQKTDTCGSGNINLKNKKCLTIGDLTARIPVIQGGMGAKSLEHVSDIMKEFEEVLSWQQE